MQASVIDPSSLTEDGMTHPVMLANECTPSEHSRSGNNATYNAAEYHTDALLFLRWH